MIKVQLILLLLAANGAPILIAKVMGKRWDYPLDGGVAWAGKPILGPSKTWRGLVGALIASSVIAPIIGLPLYVGLLLAFFSMMGDLISSFIKRRLGLASSAMAFGLDQIPEALLPTVLISAFVDLLVLDVIIVVIVFVVLDVALSQLLYRLGIKEQPY